LVEFIKPVHSYNEQGLGSLSPAFLIYETESGKKRKLQTDPKTSSNPPYSHLKSFCFSSVPYEYGGGWHYEEPCSKVAWVMYFPQEEYFQEGIESGVFHGGYCPISNKVCKEISDYIIES